MKKIKEYFLAIVIPHRMVKFKDMSILIALFLLLVGFVLAVFSNNARMSSYAEKEMFYGNYSSIIEDENNKIDDVQIEIKEAKATYKEGVYTKVLNGEGHSFHLTMVFGTVSRTKVKENESYENIQVLNFDLNDYIQYHRNNIEADTTYLLYVFTDYSVYHLYNLGQKSDNGTIIETGELNFANKTVEDENANLFNKLLGQTTKEDVVYYLPKDVSELQISTYDSTSYNYNVSNWTVQATKDETREYELSDGSKVTIKATPKLGVLGTEGVYGGVNFVINSGNLYTDLMDASVEVARKEYDAFNINVFNSSLKTFVEQYHEARVFIRQDDYKIILMLIAILVFLIIPVLFSVFVWLFTRKRGMHKYKPYLNIMSIIQFIVSILFFIVGWFVNLLDYVIVVFAGLLIMLWYFIFVIYKITAKIEQESNDQIDDHSENIKKPEPPKVQFKKIDDDSSVIG